MQDPRIPVTVITGFLGAGKTTLLNQLVQQPQMAHCAVLINEFGDVGIDHHLVDKIDDNIVVLDSGCLCCTINGDLHRALWELFQKALRKEIPRLERVVIETSGMADPTPLIYSIINDAMLNQRYRSDGIVTLVDATSADRSLGEFREALKQVAVADLLLVTKSDLADADTLQRLRAKLGLINPFAEVAFVQHGQTDAGQILNLGLFNLQQKPETVKQWLGEEANHQNSHADKDHHDHAHDHDCHDGCTHDHQGHETGNAHTEGKQDTRHTAGLETFVLHFNQPFQWASLTQCIDTLLATSGEQILRIKGLVAISGDSNPRVLQCVQHLRYPTLPLPAWPDEDHRSRLVFITRHYPRHYAEQAFEIFCGQAPA